MVRVGEEIDEHNDPIRRLERNERQASRALLEVVLSLGAVGVLILALAAGYSLTDTRCPDNAPVCLSTSGWEFVALPMALSIVLSLRIGIKAYRNWRDHIRWRPWLFASYAMWIGTTGVLIVTLTLAAPGAEGIHPALDATAV